MGLSIVAMTTAESGCKICVYIYNGISLGIGYVRHYERQGGLGCMIIWEQSRLPHI